MLKLLLGVLAIALTIYFLITIPIAIFVILAAMFALNAVVSWKENKFMVVFDVIVVYFLIKLVVWLIT